MPLDWRLLHHACWDGDPEKVAALLAQGADPNLQAPTNWRQRPLHRTLEFRVTEPKHDGHTAVVRLLLEGGADPTLRATSLDMSPWELACFAGMGDAEKLLRGAQKRVDPHPGDMSLLWLTAASRIEEAAVVRRLRPMLDTSGDINVMWRNATPLTMAAAHAGHFKVARLLLKHGADPNAGVSLLHTSCDWHLQHLLEGLDFLHGHGWCVDNADEKGQTALHKAAFLGYAQAVRKLLSFGADRNRRSRLGATPLDVAQAWRKSAVIALLE